MNLSPEQQLLIQCLQNFLHPNKTIAPNSTARWMDHIDGSVLLQLAERHRVLPIVYEVLKTSEYIPNEALQMLKHEAIRKQMQMLTLSRTLLLMLQQWQQAGIECLILKGIPLANQLYGSVALRPARDLDILIDPKQYEVVELWLLQNGYKEK